MCVSNSAPKQNVQPTGKRCSSARYPCCSRRCRLQRCPGIEYDLCLIASMSSGWMKRSWRAWRIGSGRCVEFLVLYFVGSVVDEIRCLITTTLMARLFVHRKGRALSVLTRTDSSMLVVGRLRMGLEWGQSVLQIVLGGNNTDYKKQNGEPQRLSRATIICHHSLTMRDSDFPNEIADAQTNYREGLQ